MLEAITQKVDRSVVAHPNGEKVARRFADRPWRVIASCAAVSRSPLRTKAAIARNNSGWVLNCVRNLQRE